MARRYWEDTAAVLDAILAETGDPMRALGRYPSIFRISLENEHRLCLCSFMSAEYDDLPEPVKVKVQTFTDINVAWLNKTLVAAGVVTPDQSERRARVIFAAIAGAQLVARSRADIALFDSMLDTYRAAGLIPAEAQ